MATPAVIDLASNVPSELGTKRKASQVLHDKPPAKRKPAVKKKAHVLLWVPQRGKTGGKALNSMKVLGVYSTKEKAITEKERVVSQYEANGYIFIGDKLIAGDDQIGLLTKPAECFFDND